jgi:hypothetical protein
MSTAKGTIEHNNWDEKPYREAAPLKSSEAKIDIVMHGDIEAKGPGRYLMQYPTAETCHYSGYLVLEGALGGRKGQFVIYEVGDWTNGVAASKWQIVEGSGTDELAGLSGSGSYEAQHDKTVHYALEYRLR